MALDDDVIRLAKGTNLATMVTLMPDGRPQAMLRWIDTDGDLLLVNTEPQRVAARNVRRDPRTTVLIHSAENAYDWAQVQGHVVEEVTGEEARAHIDELSQRYMGTPYKMPIGPEGRLILKIEPDKVLTAAMAMGGRR
ncbi:MAG: TIGR03618 family F420-dependent PPOX class oxidoreductase [Acidimicrobiales bacterium]